MDTSDDSKTSSRRSNRRTTSLGLTQHLFNGSRIAARKAICGILWLGLLFLFTGIILLVTSKQKGLLFKSWGGVITGIGLCLVLICIILCVHAYVVSTDAKRSEAEWDEKHPNQHLYGLPSAIQEQVDQKRYMIEIIEAAASKKQCPSEKQCPSDKQCYETNASSQEVKSTEEKQFSPGRYRLFDKNSSGVYFYPTTVQPIIEEEDDVTSIQSQSSSLSETHNLHRNTSSVTKPDMPFMPETVLNCDNTEISNFVDVTRDMSLPSSSRSRPPTYTETMERYYMKPVAHV